MAEEVVLYDGPLVSAADARKERLKFYFNGCPCLRGHIDQRYTSIGTCKECKRLYAIGYRESAPTYRKGGEKRRKRHMARCAERLLEAGRSRNLPLHIMDALKLSKRTALTRYGLSPEQFVNMFADRDCRCEICQKECLPSGNAKNSITIDHCHSSNKTRGLLCSECNKGLGGFKDSREALEAAIRYLQKYSTVENLPDSVTYVRTRGFQKGFSP